MTVLSQADYERFTWKHRKVLFSYGVTVIIIKIATGYLNLKIGIGLNDTLTVLAIAGFLFLVELVLLYNYKKSIEKMNREL
ncbi:hypothetical protein [Ferroplasma acidiphilum]|jgi:hypothetical protein|uniref:Uncharacterized protein n=1 Tax=Ferroplasma acidiphilum TaxID=74969 RepID=A0A7K4FNG9_9ARCH|nr:hypothetical protein [Ferroplasma acidiphilum]MCL4349755.1 hypothetical protein [Candidatus Thermoplasmatota archaeon]NOL59859.1 hypothetical protein [Ferroplasma acidiphilum]WMT54097.1 MAG: hypothetical protein RE473_04405 [Ferroplasma acidiphilum]